MGFFDDDELDAAKLGLEANKRDEAFRIEEARRRRKEVAKVLVQGLREFPDAANKVGLEPTLFRRTKKEGWFSEREIQHRGWEVGAKTHESIPDDCYWIETDGTCWTYSQCSVEELAEAMTEWPSLCSSVEDVRALLSAALVGRPVRK